MIGPFTWGQGGKALSATDVARNRKVAEALANRIQNPQNMWQGIQSAVGDIGGAFINKQADDAESAGRSKVAEALLAAQQGGDPNAYISVLGNEFASPAQSAVAQALLQRQWSAEDRKAAAAEAAAQPDWQTFDSGGDVYRWNANDPNSTPGMFFDGPDAPRKPPQVETRYNPETGRDEKVQWDDATGDWAPFGGQKAPDDPLVTVNTGEGADSALDKKLSEKEGEAWAGYKTAGTVSASNAQDFAVLDELIKIAPQGPIVGPLAETFKGFNSAGDAFQSIVKRIAPTLRAPGSGATSDIEYDGMLQSLPSLKNSPAGNAMVMSIMKAKAQLNVERSKLITAYQNGEVNPETGLPMTIGDARRKMNELDSVSIITPEMRQALLGIGAQDDPGATNSPAVGEVVDGYQFLGGNPASPTSWKKI